ncbi:PRTRC system protein D [Niveibacterium sp. SC-1]|uniref:PRTRC system protein D n=1 Tax=Niveibacterium sp. SC-1 TaxID=3135646 RepID=UPI00311E1B78
MNSTKHPIVRAIDVGYGNTKYVASHTHGQPIVCSLFPSLAPQAAATGDLGSGVFARRNTVPILIKGVRYEVGRDSELAQDASYGRVLDGDYSMSDTYLALLRGALHYMAQPVIDMLVLGLPVNYYDQFAERLAERMTGAHTIPDFRADDPTTARPIEVLVKHVRVVPQPIGAFLDYSTGNGSYDRMRSQLNLLIDPGYFTVDWVVSKGVKMVNSRSGSHSGGMSSILRQIADQLAPVIGAPLSDLSELDSALRDGRNPHFFGQEFTGWSEFVAMGREKARQSMQVLAAKVGNGVDIQNIILAGGGAEFFLDVVREKFPKHNVTVAKNPVFANVRGFQLAGTQFMQQAAVEAQRAPK